MRLWGRGKAAPQPCPEPLGFAVSRWRDDPYSRGGWSLLRVGASADNRIALGEAFGRVRIAGEATHPEQAGMTHGAYEQGEEAALQCIRRGDRRVVVVGAGAAGIAAARALQRAGIAVDLLEARERIGGRAWTARLQVPGAGASVVELGANWLQQGARNGLAVLAHAAGLQLVHTDFGNPLDIGDVPDGQDSNRISAILAALKTRVADSTRQHDLPLAEVVERYIRDPAPFSEAAIRHAIDAEVVLDTGVSLGDLSARCGFEPGVGAGDRWMPAGYGALFESLLGDIRPRLGYSVERIEWSDTGVRVHGTTGEQLAADAAIVTVPAAVLSEGRPTFDPPLPERQRLGLAGIQTGRAEKIALRFRERWWPVSDSAYLRIAGTQPGQISEWLDLSDTLGVPVITGIFVGRWAAELWDGLDNAQVAAAASRVLFEATRRTAQSNRATTAATRS